MSINDKKIRLTKGKGKELSLRMYNGVLCGTLLYGLVVNFILCLTVKDITQYIDPVLFILSYFVLTLIGIIISKVSDNAFVSFIGYNMVVVPVGLVVSFFVDLYGEISSDVVTDAFLITTCITAGMTILGITKPEFCSRLGRLLFVSLIGLLIAEVFLLLIGHNNIATSWIAAIIFSFYIAYDVYRSQQYRKTLDNAVDSAMDIYVDVANLFLRIMEILGKRN